EVPGQTGSTVSVLAGLDHVVEVSGLLTSTLILDADIVFERALLNWIVADCVASRLFTVDRTAGDEEEVRVYADHNHRPVLIGKGLDRRLTSDLVMQGESIGIIYISPAELQLVRSLSEWLTGRPPHVAPYGFAKRQSE